jgi:hypothetical protein
VKNGLLFRRGKKRQEKLNLSKVSGVSTVYYFHNLELAEAQQTLHK